MSPPSPPNPPAPAASPAPSETQRLHAFVALLLRLAGRFINLPPARTEAEVERALADTAAFVEADRGYLFAYDLAAGTTSNTHEWCAPGITPQREALQDLPVDLFPDWLAAHQRGDPLFVPDVAALDAGDPMRQVLEPQGIRTTVALPLLDEQGCTGFVGFDFVRELRAIGTQEMGLLQLFAQMLVNVNARGRAEAVLHALNASLEARVAERTRELAAATERAETANRAKSALMARVSHELRTPLNAVLGFSQLLAMDDAVRASASARRQLEQVHAAGEHLLQMVDEMLNIASAETGRLHLRREAVEIGPLVAEALALVEPLARRRAIALHGPAADPALPAAWADRTRLRQILVNLLSNAVKYNRDSGRVEVQLGGDGDQVQVAVQDSGPGLTPQQLQSIFDPFERAGAEQGTVQGTGLGLTIARQLALAMGGALAASSEPGRGSRFVLTLAASTRPWAPDAPGGVASGAGPAPDRSPPREPAEGPARMPARNPARAPAPAPPRPPVRVLYVEDNPVNVLLMEAMMSRPECTGVLLHTASDGPTGLAAARSLMPDLVLLDMALPGFGGLQLLQRLRDDPATAGIPCVAVSANAMPHDVQQARQAGFSDYLTKPFRFEALAAIVDRFRPPPAGGG
mgnify:FL=1